MRAIVKLTTTKEEVILTVRASDIKKVIYDLNYKEQRLRKLYGIGQYKRTIVTGQKLSKMEIEKIRRILEKIANTEIEFIDNYSITNQIQREKLKVKLEEAAKKSEEIQEKQKEAQEEGELGLHAIKSTFESEIQTSETKFIYGNLRSRTKRRVCRKFSSYRRFKLWCRSNCW